MHTNNNNAQVATSTSQLQGVPTSQLATFALDGVGDDGAAVDGCDDDGDAVDGVADDGVAVVPALPLTARL